MFAPVFISMVVLSSTAQRPTHVTFTAPDRCASADFFERALIFRTDRVQLVKDLSEATAFLNVAVVAKGKRITGTLNVRTPEGGSTKEVRGTKCDSVVGALALAAALLLDPEGAKLGPLPKELPPVPVEEQQPAPALEPEPVVVAAVQPEPIALPEAPPPTIATPVATPSRRERAWQFSLEASGFLSTGISGQGDFGGALGAELTWKLLAARARVALGNGHTFQNSAGAGGYTLHVRPELEAGLRWPGAVLRPELGARASFTFVTIGPAIAEEQLPSLRFLPAVGPYARLALRLEQWSLGLSAALGVNLKVERYRIEPLGELFTVPPIFGAVSFSVARSLP